MNLNFRWLIMQMRPRVVHRIPGRLRLHIPALKKVESDFQEVSDTLISDFHLPAGIKLARINYISGNIVINYNPDITNERHVLVWILDVKKIFETTFLQFEKMDEERIQNSVFKLKEFLKSVSNNGTIIDQTFKIPDEIWN